MTTSSGPGSESALRRATALGTAWVGISRGVNSIIQILTLVIVARLLGPSEMGLMAMASIYIAIGQVIADVGLSSALIQYPRIEAEHASAAWWIGIAMATLLVGLGALLAQPLAEFFREPALASLIVFASFVFPIAATGNVAGALLTRDLRFRELARAEVMATLVGGSVAIVSAWAGVGVYALVLQSLVGASVYSLLAVAARGHWGFGAFRLRAIRPMLGFSTGVLGAGVVNYAGRRLDDLIVGRILGSSALGIYSIAYRVMLYPVQNISWVVLRVAFPAFSRRQDSQEHLRPAYVQLVTFIAFATYPMMAFAALLAPELVETLFGSAWAPAAPLIALLAIVGAIQSTSTCAGTVWKATGRTKLLLVWEVLSTILVLSAVLIGVDRGLRGVAVAYVVVACPIGLIAHAVTNRQLGLSHGDLLWRLRAPILGALALVCGMSLLRRFVEGFMPSFAMLGLGGLAGCVAYLASVRIIDSRLWREIFDHARLAFHRNGGPPPAEPS